MFLLFDVATENWIPDFIPESLEVLIFGIGLVLLAIGLRALLRRSERNADGEIKHTTK